MNLNNETSVLQTRKILGNEGSQIYANVPAPSNGAGFRFTPGGISINGDNIQTSGGLQFDLPIATVQAMQAQALAFSANNSALNRGFVGNVITSGQTAINNSQQAVLDFGKNVMQQTNALSGKILQTQKTVARLTNDKGIFGCYITTAICEVDGLPDDCDILQTFRKFRDTYMQETEARRIQIKAYYDTAPQMLEVIRKRKDYPRVIESLKCDYLIPAYLAIKRNSMREAHEFYVRLVNAANLFAMGD